MGLKPVVHDHYRRVSEPGQWFSPEWSKLGVERLCEGAKREQSVLGSDRLVHREHPAVEEEAAWHCGCRRAYALTRRALWRILHSTPTGYPTILATSPHTRMIGTQTMALIRSPSDSPRIMGRKRL